MKIFFTLYLTLLFSVALLAQEHKEFGSSIEVITSAISAYSFEEKNSTFGTEIHITYWLNHKIGIGSSYSAKFEEDETLSDIALLASWNAKKWLTVNAGPNFSFEGKHRDFGVTLYAETEFNYHISESFHLGPVIGALIGKSSEISAGIQLGLEF